MSIGLRYFVVAFGYIVLFVWSSFPAFAHSYSYIASGSTYLSAGPARVSIRSGSRDLPCFVYGGQYYVLGQRGLRYSILVQNQTNKRLEVVVSVDGRDVISGVRDSSFARRGYILNPYRYVDINGFRTSKSHVASFRFTSVGNAYSTRMGDSWFRVGRIHLAVFYERSPVAYIPRPVPVRPPYPYWRHRYDRGGSHQEQAPATGKSARSNKPASGADGRSYDSSEPKSRIYRWRRIPTPTNRPDLGTAYGQTVYAPAEYTTFERLTSYPSHQLTLQYNNCEGFHKSRICTRWCPCYRRWHHPRPLLQHHDPQSPRFTPPPPQW